MKQMRDNFRKYQHVVERIHHLSGAPGLAIGVYHRDQIVYEDYRGLRDVEQNLPVNRDTIFHIASLTKAITAIAVGILVDQGKLDWDAPLDTILPFFKEPQSEKSKLSVVDVLCHRSGTTWGDALYLQSNNRIMLPKSESLPTFQYLPTVAAPRSQYIYNNHAYNIPGFVIEAVSKQTYKEFLESNIFQPLGMNRTFTETATDSNRAVPYNVLSDGTPFKIPFSDASSETMMFSAVSVRTTMADILRLYEVMLKNLKVLVPGTESSSQCDAKTITKWPDLLSWLTSANIVSEQPKRSDIMSLSSTIKQANYLTHPYIARSFDTLYEQSSALGWMRTQLPGKLEFGWNSSNVSSMPLFGKGYPERLALWHGGNLPGTTAAAILLPETTTAVVVFQNSLGLCDAADFTAQLLLDCLFVGKPQYDYISLAKEAVTNGVARMERVAEQLKSEQQHGTDHRPLEEYVGNYENSIKNWTIQIGLDESNQLFLRFQGRADEQYSLHHYHYDVFTWNLSYDETVKRAQYCRPHQYYKFHFEPQNDRISFLRWHHDPYVKDGELFSRIRE